MTLSSITWNDLLFAFHGRLCQNLGRDRRDLVVKDATDLANQVLEFWLRQLTQLDTGKPWLGMLLFVGKDGLLKLEFFF